MDVRERNKRRIFAQNFLVDEKYSKMIVAAAELNRQDTVLEIGPGDGALTSLLAAQAGGVIAVEKDPIVGESLRPSLRMHNVSLIQGDIITYEYLHHFKRETDGISDFVVVSNLPYNAGTHIVQMLLTARVRPKRVVVMLQKEVAERICAKPGDFSMLSLVCQWFSETRMLFDVPREAFRPQPNVTSTVILLTPKPNTRLLLPCGQEKEVFRIAKIGFSSKRKKLSNNLQAGLQIPRETVENFLQTIGLEKNIRAEELAPENWLKIAKKFGTMGRV
jgi:16S rRNA (adenine1518-N6/adenine1519-N6)-dimethyltransferase